jgi:hypothetical protein
MTVFLKILCQMTLNIMTPDEIYLNQMALIKWQCINWPSIKWRSSNGRHNKCHANKWQLVNGLFTKWQPIKWQLVKFMKSNNISSNDRGNDILWGDPWNYKKTKVKADCSVSLSHFLVCSNNNIYMPLTTFISRVQRLPVYFLRSDPKNPPTASPNIAIQTSENFERYTFIKTKIAMFSRWVESESKSHVEQSGDTVRMFANLIQSQVSAIYELDISECNQKCSQYKR